MELENLTASFLISLHGKMQHIPRKNMRNRTLEKEKKMVTETYKKGLHVAVAKKREKKKRKT